MIRLLQARRSLVRCRTVRAAVRLSQGPFGPAAGVLLDFGAASRLPNRTAADDEHA